MAKTILIVEDDPNISVLVPMYLEKEGYNTRIASDGGQGLDLFRQLRPDLVLLDIMLPVMDGWSVLRTIRQDYGSAESYLEAEYGLTPARLMRLRRMYLE